MKLYATVSSERATKGQGGNWIDIELSDDSKNIFATIKVRARDCGLRETIELWHTSHTSQVFVFDNAKGEKLKTA